MKSSSERITSLSKAFWAAISLRGVFAAISLRSKVVKILVFAAISLRAEVVTLRARLGLLSEFLLWSMRAQGIRELGILRLDQSCAVTQRVFGRGREAALAVTRRGSLGMSIPGAPLSVQSPAHAAYLCLSEHVYVERKSNTVEARRNRHTDVWAQAISKRSKVVNSELLTI